MAKWNFNETEFNAIQEERDALKSQVEELKSENKSTIIRMKEMTKKIKILEAQSAVTSETPIWAVSALAQRSGQVGVRTVQVTAVSEEDAIEHGMKKIRGMNLGYKIYSPEALRIVVDKNET